MVREDAMRQDVHSVPRNVPRPQVSTCERRQQLEKRSLKQANELTPIALWIKRRGNFQFMVPFVQKSEITFPLVHNDNYSTSCDPS